MLAIGDRLIQDTALSRAREIFERSNQVDLAVGFCEGVIEVNGRWYTSAACVIVDNQGRVALASGLRTELTKSLIVQLESGTLTEGDIEILVQNAFENPYEYLVQSALSKLES